MFCILEAYSTKISPFYFWEVHGTVEECRFLWNLRSIHTALRVLARGKQGLLNLGKKS